MKEFYGKALSRKAEALEQMEKWGEAGSVWQLCVESGVGGPTALAGRQAMSEGSGAQACRQTDAKARLPPSRGPRPAGSSRRRAPMRWNGSVPPTRRPSKKVMEKFALTDKVDARIAAWRDGKRDNLRALLSSLDNVLWENMMAGRRSDSTSLSSQIRSRFHYMKAIAKTHPDKVSYHLHLPALKRITSRD